MRKFFLTVAMMISAVTFASAQRLKDVTFLGVDFSAVNVLYADETQDKFMSAFEGINTLMVSEMDKYNVGKYLDMDIEEIEIKYAFLNIATLQDRNFTDLQEEKISIETVLSAYPEVDGLALLLVAKELNKPRAVGLYDIVVFDGTTKEIIKTDSFMGSAGGFGLRNYWAGSIYNGLKKYWRKR